MNPLYLLVLIPTVLILAFCAMISIRQRRNRWKYVYKRLMVEIVQCNNYQELCQLELDVDSFYELAYPERPKEVAAMAINLYTAINDRTLELTGMKTYDPREDLGRLLQA